MHDALDSKARIALHTLHLSVVEQGCAMGLGAGGRTVGQVDTIQDRGVGMNVGREPWTRNAARSSPRRSAWSCAGSEADPWCWRGGRRRSSIGEYHLEETWPGKIPPHVAEARKRHQHYVTRGYGLARGKRGSWERRAGRRLRDGIYLAPSGKLEARVFDTYNQRPPPAPSCAAPQSEAGAAARGRSGVPWNGSI